MAVKNIFKIQSTGELCVEEGADMSISPETIQQAKHIRIIDPKSYELTDITRSVYPSDLVPYLSWNGYEYVSP